MKSSWCNSSPVKAVAGGPVTSVAIRRVTGGCEAYTVSKQAVRISSEIAHIAMPTPLTRRKAASEPPLCEVMLGVAGVSSPGHAYQGISREPRRALCLSRHVGLVPPNPKTPGSRRARAASVESEQALDARVIGGQGKPEAAMNGTREVLRAHSTDEGGEPQGSRKGRPRYPLEGRGEQVDVSTQNHRYETPNSGK